MGDTAPAIVNEPAVRAEIHRIAEERYVARYTSERTGRFFLSVVAFAAILSALPLIPIVRGFLHVGPMTLAVAMAVVLVAIGTATLAAHSAGGILGAAHQKADRVESIVIAVVAAGLIRASDQVMSIFWLISVMHAMTAAQDTRHAKWSQSAHGFSLGVVALSFATAGRFADAAAAVFFTILLLFLASSAYAAAAREIRLQAERNVLLVDNERQRIARDLHDGIGAQLASLAWTTEGEVGERARIMLGELRDVVKGLKANDMRLGALVESLAVSCKPLAQSCALELTHEGDVLVRAETCLELTLIAREAIRNAAQHASASRIDVRFAFAHDVLTLCIADDGHGLAEDKIADSRGGLSHLRRRAEILGGDLRFDRPAPGQQGTRIVLGVPLRFT